MTATERRYHIPRSQVFAGSRGGQSGKVHLHVTEQLDHGRLHRRPGQALCGRDAWMDREPQDGEETCPRCAEIAERIGVGQ